jgi:hypothetical protein
MTLSSPIPAVRSDPGGLGAWSSGGRSGRDNRACGSSGVAARFRVPRSPFNVSRRGKGIGQLAPPVKVNWRFALGSMHYALTTRVGPIRWAYRMRFGKPQNSGMSVGLLRIMRLAKHNCETG